MSFAKGLWRFLRIRKKYWLLPIVVMMVAFAALIVLTQGSSAEFRYFDF
ncbi:MAG: DUF5989 family protein [Usitatibacter sp.]